MLPWNNSYFVSLFSSASGDRKDIQRCYLFKMRYNVQTCPSPGGGGRLQARTMSSSCWANTDLSAGELLFALTTPAVIDVVTQNRLTLAVKRYTCSIFDADRKKVNVIKVLIMVYNTRIKI
ncbi:hypothetical protein CDAR_90091 [Caerostris darwini]|uniref:Uncharacterized protein n=1 Tax=Caerostris darwini TaxID=1538125 RepID=A0AAV4QGK3_9ARAC|nr:hypothetical protein CDAR_90091 [Caerostris darwini]